MRTAHALTLVSALAAVVLPCRHGFDLNANTLQPVLVQCTATGNGGQDFGGVTP